MTPVFDPFAPLFTRAGGFTAPADVIVGESDLLLTMDLPGLTADDLARGLDGAHGPRPRRADGDHRPDGDDRRARATAGLEDRSARAAAPARRTLTAVAGLECPAPC